VLLVRLAYLTLENLGHFLACEFFGGVNGYTPRMSLEVLSQCLFVFASGFLRFKRSYRRAPTSRKIDAIEESAIEEYQQVRGTGSFSPGSINREPPRDRRADETGADNGYVGARSFHASLWFFPD